MEKSWKINVEKEGAPWHQVSNYVHLVKMNPCDQRDGGFPNSFLHQLRSRLSNT